jgi:3-oxoacyl-[acyl-carrier-protein] synthase II
MPVVSAWSAVSPYGVGRTAFVEGIRAGRAVAAGASEPDLPGVVVPGFSAREVLGRKGTRSMDRTTALAVAAIGQLADERAGRGTAFGPGTALVLGTTTGSVQSMMDFTRDSLVEERPYFVDPARFPNTVMNCAAGQCAIWHRLTGPNTTIAGGRASALSALSYARRLQQAGRASAVLCGATEEASPWRTRLDRYAGGDAHRLGEGCAVLLLEPPDTADRGQADVLSIRLDVCHDGDLRSALAACLHRAMQDAGIRPADIGVVAPSQPGSVPGKQEEAAIADLVGGHEPAVIRTTELIGDAGAATGALQLAAVLAAPPADPAAPVALVTTVDVDGVVGCVLLRHREGRA